MSKADNVRLVRDAKTFPDSHEANVEPDDIEAWTQRGWSVAGEAESGGYDAMKVAELKALAAARGIELGDAVKKADIIAALELADEAADALDAPVGDGGLTLREIHADLDGMGVEFDPTAPAEDQLALRNEARAKRDAEGSAE